jgi:hypothetical protein
MRDQMKKQQPSPKKKAAKKVSVNLNPEGAALLKAALGPELLLVTPQITLTATLDDLSGIAAGTVSNPAKVRIALCGFGLVIPQIVGTCTLAKIGPTDYLSTGEALSIQLWGNDVINPLGTYYAITILDGEDNIVQCGSYQFTGTQTIDLSSAAQIVPSNTLEYAPCTGDVPGTVYIAAGMVIGALYNGVFLRPGIDYTLSALGKQINLTFSTQKGEDGNPDDVISALCSVVIASSLAPGASMLRYVVCAGDIPGTVYTAPGKIVAVAYNGDLQPSTEYTLSGNTFTLNFSTEEGDTIYALCF